MNNDPVSIRRGEYLRLVFSFLWNRPAGASIREILVHISRSIQLSEDERAPFPHLPNFANYEVDLRATMAGASRAGWLVKENGTWHVTQEGRLACKDFSSMQEFYSESQRHGQESLLNHPASQIAIEYAEEMAWNQIRQFLQDLPHQEFRSLVQHLLQAMDYQVAWVAPLSKQRGQVDMIVFPDPLGLKQPRMIVNIKHGKQSVSAESLKAFSSSLGKEDVGLVVSSGGFGQEAESLVPPGSQGRVFLVDLEKLFSLWLEHFEKLTSEAQRCFPLKAIYFLALQA
jgi:restriction system protein